MRASVLGPLSLEGDLGPVPLSAGRVRTLLELLLLRPNETLPAAVLTDRLWPGSSPTDEATTRRLHTTVSRLRHVLGGQREPGRSALTVVTDAGGYRLHATAEGLDRIAFERAAEVAFAAKEVAAIDAALALWRGEPYTGFPLEPEIQAQRTHLVDLRRRLLEVRLEISEAPPLGAQLERARLRPPQDRPATTLTRQDLLADAPEVGEVAVLSVEAPAGYGKSAVLAQWARRQTAPVAWIGLDDDDNDPARVWAAVLRSVGHAGPYPVEALDRQLTPGSPPFLEALCGMIDDAGGRLGVVLDDLHHVTDPELHDQIERCVELLPAGCTLALASRSALPLPVGRWQAEGRLHLLTDEDLAFDVDDVASLLELHGVTGGHERARRLHDVTGGWPVAVTLLLRAGVDEAAFGARTAALSRYIVDEVLATLPDDVARFVLETAHLKQFNATLCDAVTQRTDSARMLAWLLDHGLFLVRVDDAAAWLRYHDLIGAHLRSHTRAIGDVDIEEIDRRAARWHYTHGLEEEALPYALRAREPGIVAAAAGEVLARAALRGEAATCRSWLERLDPDDLATNPRSHAIAVYLTVLWADHHARIPWVQNRERRFGGDADVVLTFARAVESMREGRSGAAVELSERVMKEAWEAAHLIAPDLARILGGSALSNLVMARLLQDTLRHDDDLLPNTVALLRPAAPNIAAWIHSYWALIAYVDGEEDLAASLAAEFHAGLLTPEQLSVSDLESAVVGALLASNRTSDPEQHRRLADGIQNSIRIRERLGMHTETAIARIIAACLYRRAGAFTEAAEHDGRADVLMRTFEDAPFLHRLRDHLACTSFGRAGRSASPDERPLTARERTVLAMLSSPLTMPEIAGELHVSTSTVRSHVSAIYRKLGVTSRHQAVAKSRTGGR